MRVHLIMPVIPHYRVSLMDALAATPGIAFSTQASREFPGLPRSVDRLPAWADLDRPVRAYFGERLFWQSGLGLPDGFTSGDVLIVIGNPRYLSNFPLIREARARGGGVVWWGHGWSSTSKAWRASLRYRLMNVADVVLLYTKHEVQSLAHLSERIPPMLSIDNALDQRPIREAAQSWTPKALAEFKASRGLAGVQLFLFCGRLRRDPPTGLDIAFDALARLSSRFPELRLCIVGSGDDESRLKAKAHALGLAERVIWAGEIHDEHSLAPWFMNSVAFLYPGSVGLSLMHAFGYGLPVITHCERQIHGPEFAALRDGENGLLFARDDARDLAVKLSALLDDSNLLRRVSHGAADTVRSEYTFEGMLANLLTAVRLASRLGLNRQFANQSAKA
jgi:glycosyltransferase involved in cell wall biosynthesis